MSTCQKCGREYKVDLIINDMLWKRIKPKEKLGGSGLLCPQCILEKIEKIYGYSAWTIGQI